MKRLLSAGCQGTGTLGAAGGLLGREGGASLGREESFLPCARGGSGLLTVAFSTLCRASAEDVFDQPLCVSLPRVPAMESAKAVLYRLFACGGAAFTAHLKVCWWS